MSCKYRACPLIPTLVASRSDSILPHTYCQQIRLHHFHTCCKQIRHHPLPHLLQADHTPLASTVSRSDSISYSHLLQADQTPSFPRMLQADQAPSFPHMLQADQTPSHPTPVASRNRSDSISSHISCKQIRLISSHISYNQIRSSSFSTPVASRSHSISCITCKQMRLISFHISCNQIKSSSLSTPVASRSHSISSRISCKQTRLYPLPHMLQADQTPSPPASVVSRSDSSLPKHVGKQIRSLSQKCCKHTVQVLIPSHTYCKQIRFYPL